MQSQGAEQTVLPVSGSKTTGNGLRTLLIGLLGLSLIPLGLAGAPPALVRPARFAWLIASRRLNITLFGILLVAAAAIAYVLGSHS